MAKSVHKSKVMPVAADEAKRIIDKLDEAIKHHQGGIDIVEQAVGMYLVGRHFGWRVLYLVHSKRTIRKYEEILGIKVQEEFPEVGTDADRSVAWLAAKKVSNFWKAVSGDVRLEVEDRREIAKGT